MKFGMLYTIATQNNLLIFQPISKLQVPVKIPGTFINMVALKVFH